MSDRQRPATRTGAADVPVRAQPAAAATRAGWDSYAPARPLQTWWVTAAVISGVPGLAATFFRVVPPSDDIPALFASFASYGVVAYLLSTLFLVIALLRARRRAVFAALTVLSACLLGCRLAWLAPFFIPDHRDASSPTFTLMTLNTKHGSADPQQVARQAQGADMVILLEADARLVQEVRPSGWDQRFPYSAGELNTTGGDTILYSRFPLSSAAPLPESQSQQWMATAAVPGIGQVRVIAAHPCNPYCGGNRFRSEHQQLRTSADAYLGMPLVVAGDLNATDDHAPMLRLRADGLKSVADITGAGWLPTYPANSAIPPLVPIDHVLVNHFLTATSVHRIHVADTDHLGLMTQIASAR